MSETYWYVFNETYSEWELGHEFYARLEEEGRCSMAFRQKAESPIETLFTDTLFRMMDMFDVEVTPQAQIDCYRVDYLFESGATRIAVELDGHEFHERSKNQASRDKKRDRHLDKLGIRTLRFTGSEVYRDPVGCVSEVLERFNQTV